MAIDHYPLPLQGKPERRHLYRWTAREENYVREKFETSNYVTQRDAQDHSLRVEGPGGFWARQVVQYYDRADAFLAEARQCEDPSERRQLELRAQQAMAKAFMTAKAAVESSIRVFGHLPAPGVTSGEVKEWAG